MGEKPKEHETFEVRCKCGKAKTTFYKSIPREEAVLLPTELFCTGCGETLKVKDFMK